MPSATVSVVVPCHNAATTVLATLRALEESTLPPTEVIVVDDGSTDETVELVGRHAQTSALALRLCRTGERGGAGAARNLGAGMAAGEYLLFVDADVIVEPPALAEMVERLTSCDCDAVTGLYLDHSQAPGLLAHFQAFLAAFVFRRIPADDAPYFGTQCGMMRRATFRRLGGFDPRYRGATVEDFELGLRLRAQGGRLCVAERARMVHNHRYDWRAFARNYRVKARDLARLAMANEGDPLRRVGYFEPALVRDLARGAGESAGWPRAAAFGALFLVVVVCGAVGALQARWPGGSS